MQLRPYQSKVVEDTHEAIAQGSTHPLIVAGTGAGKTVIAAKLLQDFTQQGKRCLFLVHLDCLVNQTADKLESFGVDHGFIKAGFDEDRSAPVQIASVQTLPRRHWWKEHQFDVIFLDEAHKTAWSGIADRLMVEHYPQSVFIGLTATPWRLSKAQGMGDRFDSLILAPLPRELMDAGYLVRPRYFSLPQADLEGVATVAGDYNESDLGVVCNRPDLVEKLVQEYQRITPGQRAIAFGVNIAHSRAIADEFNRQGIPAMAITGDTPIAERNRVYQQLADGELLAIASCAVLTEGFDCPAAQVALMARPTKSRALYFQQLGRVLRPSPGKDGATVLDQAGNVPRFGFVEDLSEFELTLGQPKHPGEMPNKVCGSKGEDQRGKPGCGAILRISTPLCPHCEYLFDGQIKIAQAGELEEVARIKRKLPAILPPPHKVEIDQLIEEMQHRGRKPGWVGYRVMELPNVTQADLRYVAQKLNYSAGWAFHRWRELNQPPARATG